MYKKGRVNSNSRIISTDEDPSLRIESSAIINLRGVSTKLNKYIVFTMQAYKKLRFPSVYSYFVSPTRPNQRSKLKNPRWRLKRAKSTDIYLSGLLARCQNAWSQDGGNMRVITEGTFVYAVQK